MHGKQTRRSCGGLVCNFASRVVRFIVTVHMVAMAMLLIVFFGMLVSKAAR